MAEKNERKITFETDVEDLALKYPKSVHFLTANNVRCIRCGEPLWCSVGELFEMDHVENPEKLLSELNDFIDENYSE
ncbi:hypothetical protein B6D60_11775 [candidate division KSB1 bacterium 4484_87]|nr:MAG: hypothetical protein B6D60_11775 [candidate division KSB1 bacterium 4484_87]